VDNKIENKNSFVEKHTKRVVRLYGWEREREREGERKKEGGECISGRGYTGSFCPFLKATICLYITSDEGMGFDHEWFIPAAK